VDVAVRFGDPVVGTTGGRTGPVDRGRWVVLTGQVLVLRD
jgi:hypothetical protein